MQVEALSSSPVLLLSVVLLGVLFSFALWWKKAGASKLPAASAHEEGKVAVQDAASKERALILFGTQTGTAERFAKQLRTELTTRYGESTSYEVMDLEEFSGPEQLHKEKTIFLLMATYGDGEPTDNAADFYNWLIKAGGEAESNAEAKQKHKGVNFGVFALGNKQYEHFCMVGKRAHTAMVSLGANPLVERGDGDDDEDIDADFELWRTELFTALDKLAEAAGKPQVKEPVATQVVAAASSVPSYDVQIFTGAESESKGASLQSAGSGLNVSHPFPARVGVVRELHCACSTRSCLHVELDTSATSMPYQTGDHVGILCENVPEVVEAAAAALGVSPETSFSLSVPASNPHALSPPTFTGPITLRAALRSHVDLTGPVNKQSVQALAAFASGEAAATLQKLLRPEGAAAYKAWQLQSRSLIEVLQEFSSIHPPLGAFFASIASPLQARFYSISSSPLLHPQSVHVTCAVVKEPTATGRMLEGVASHYLGRQKPPKATVPCFIRRSAFKLPGPAVPLIMIGPGTGIAPFRGFLQHRQALLAKGQKLAPAYLFFGCRTRREDYIYESELEAWVASGVLTKLFVAFSRDQKEKDYVQHHIAKQAALVAPLLREDALGSTYICGDARHMAKDVARALAAVISGAEGISTGEAENRLKTLSAAGRLQRDVW